MNLFLVQHGDAVSKDVDPDRPLSEQGERDLRHLAEFLAEHITGPLRIMHSVKTRARQSAGLLAEGLSPHAEVHELGGLQPSDPVKPFARVLEREEGDLIVVGHMPFLGRLLARLLKCDEETVLVDFVPGTLVVLEHGDDHLWRITCVLRPTGSWE